MKDCTHIAPPPFTGEGDRKRSEAVEGVSLRLRTRPPSASLREGTSPASGGGTERSVP
jgi:hypothetical protein